jgi:hypothetical protein
MTPDPAITARGALAGAVGAGVWAAAMPLDKRLFGLDYDDCEILGRAVAAGAAAAPVGLALHVAGGAAFGAAYANVARRVPLPSWAVGPLAGVAEHLATWPLTAFVDRVHPARNDLPRLWGSGRAFAQSLWRHLLFGVVLGELERRLNAPEDEDVPSYEHVVSSNGHGNLEHAMAGPPA